MKFESKNKSMLEIFNKKWKKKKKDKMTEEELKDYEEEERRAQIDPNELLVADCLSAFIKYNPHLHHLDLQGCGLTNYILIEIGSALRKSKSLVGIHLSENPGLTTEMKEQLFARVHCKSSDFSDPHKIDLSEIEKQQRNDDWI